MNAWLARLLLGAILLAASLDKIFEPVVFAQAISNYRLLPDWAIPVAALTLPWLELVVGSCLLIGFLTDSASLLAASLGLLFAAALGSALWRGLDIDCGCFATARRVSWTAVVFDLTLLLLAVFVLRRGPGRWALDSRFTPPRQPADPE